jgi:hypothetical protein
MKLQFQPPSLGAPRHLLALCALLAPKQPVPFQPRLQLSLLCLQTTKKSILRSLFLAPVLVPEAFSHNPNTIEFA